VNLRQDINTRSSTRNRRKCHDLENHEDLTALLSQRTFLVDVPVLHLVGALILAVDPSDLSLLETLPALATFSMLLLNRLESESRTIADLL
jgi:hypothetical protein